MPKTLLLIVLLALAWPTLASQPGEPLDCSDWVILESGITCREVRPCGAEPTTSGLDFPCASASRDSIGMNGTSISAEGSIVDIELRQPDPPYCGYTWGKPRLELKTFDGSTERLLGYVENRCLNPGCEDRIEVYGRSFNAIRGQFYVLFGSYSHQCPTSYSRSWLASFDGFATTFEVLQTYTPQPAQLAFRVPAHPEALRAADHFDTYWGRVADLPDFTKAVAMACNYPASPPAAGTRLTVADTSPMPAPGQANYTVTAVTYGAERRYGRQKLGPTMMGRDPGLLPACP